MAAERILRYGPAFVPLAAFLVWGGFAWAVGLRGRAVLAVGVLACATALAHAIFIAGSGSLRGENDRRAVPPSRLRPRGASPAVETRWVPGR